MDEQQSQRGPWVGCDGKSQHVTTHKFALRQRVRMVELECVGVVRNIQLCESGTAYKVSFYLDGKRAEEWVYEDEIEAVES